MGLSSPPEKVSPDFSPYKVLRYTFTKEGNTVTLRDDDSGITRDFCLDCLRKIAKVVGRTKSWPVERQWAAMALKLYYNWNLRKEHCDR